jgi:hypothetical protein
MPPSTLFAPCRLVEFPAGLEPLCATFRIAVVIDRIISVL